MKANKISDFGQKIGGARKDFFRIYIDRMAAVTNDALILKPLSKVYKLPDIPALWRAGEITEDQAILAWYVWTLIEKKPQRYGVSAWAANTYTLLQAFTDVLTGECNELPDSVLQVADREKYDYFNMEVKAAGWPEKEYKRGVYRVTKRLFNSSSSKPYTVVSGRYYKGDYTTMNEAVVRIRELVASEKTNENKFEIRHWTQTDERFICPVGKSGIVLRRGIENAKEARRIITEEANELQAEYERLRTFPDERRDWNRPRLGDNFRDGLDISPECFGALVPFRGVEFGNWVNQLERAACLNECADALWDLSKITGVRLDVLAQNGTLAMAFGARGATKARAHYEPMKRVINITKRTGAGCLAHEWFHSLDNYIMIRENQPLMYAVSDCKCINNARIQQAASALNIAINRSNYARRSEKIDDYKSKKYWGTMVELSARAFEAFVFFKMEAVGMVNDYLVNFKTSDEYERSDCYPYPTREEAETFAPLFESFFDAVFSAEERSCSFSCATPVIALAIAAPEAEEVVEVATEVVSEPTGEVMGTDQPEDAPIVEEIVPYGDTEKSPFFPESLAAHRKYFAVVEKFCDTFNLIYHFELLNEKKVRLFVMFGNGERVFFDYEVTSRHRDVFAFREHDEKRHRLKNWSVALETMKELISQSSGGNPEEAKQEVEITPVVEISTYGDTEKSQPIQIAASESLNDAQAQMLPVNRPEIQLKEEDKDKMRLLNSKNEYCIAYTDLLNLCKKHEKAFAQNDFYTCALIEYRLTNINFHSECGMLYAGEYNKLKQEIKKEMEADNNIPYGESLKSQCTENNNEVKETNEVWAQFIRELSGVYIEMYKVRTHIGKVMYWGRDNYQGHSYEWYTLSDAPYGYCEKDCPVNSKIKIHICDKNGNILFDTYNGDSKFIPCFEDCIDQALKAVPNITNVLEKSIRKYLNPFIEKLKIENETDKMNFYDFSNEQTDSEILFPFTWMGRTYDFCVLSYKHTLCSAHWKEIAVIDKEEGGIRKFLGSIIPPYGESQKSPVQLLPENVTLQMVANGILGDEESTNIAKHIIAEGLEEQFNLFRAKDKYANGSLMDLFDTVVNFPIHNSEIRLYGDCVELKYLHFQGMKPEESLQNLFNYANEKDCELMDECEFKLRGVKGFLPFNSYLFHQCFAEGRITVDELIKMLQELEN